MNSTSHLNCKTRIVTVLLTITFFCFTSPPVAQATNFNWAKQAGGTDQDYGIDMDTDASGNCLVTGNYRGTATFGSVTLLSSGIFIAKYDPAGNLHWAKQAVDNGRVKSITLDPSDNIIITGAFRGTINIDTLSFTSNGFYDIFIAKFDPDGNILWAEHTGSAASDDKGLSVAADGAGNIIVSGEFTNSVPFGATTLTSMGGIDAFVAKYDAAGNNIWAVRAGTAANDRGHGNAAENSGNSFVTGDFSGKAFIAKLDASGNFLWTKTTSGGVAIGRNIAVDGSGNSTFIGNFGGSVHFESITLTSSGSRDIFIARYDGAGNALWAEQAGGILDDRGMSIDVDGSGNSYTIGLFQDTATFQTITLTSAGEGDISIAKYDPAGNCLWVEQAGGTGHEVGRGIALNSADDIFITGDFQESASFGTTALSSVGLSDIFVAKLGSELPVFRYEYAAKMICGIQRGSNNLRLPKGSYTTMINIHNPNERRVEFLKKLALTYPPKEQKPGLVDTIGIDILGPDEALKVDCIDIQGKLFPNGFPTPFIEGFVVIKSSESIDVSAVYTVAKPGSLLSSERVTSIDVEQIRERKLKVTD